MDVLGNILKTFDTTAQRIRENYIIILSNTFAAHQYLMVLYAVGVCGPSKILFIWILFSQRK